MEEKRVDLETEKQKRLLLRIVKTLSQTDPDLYYRPTSEVARAIKDYVKAARDLTQEDRALLKPLSPREMEILLSYH